MPIPVLGSISSVAGLGTLFSSLFAYLISAGVYWRVQKIGWALLVLAALSAVYTTLFVLLNTLVFAVVQPISNEYVRMGFYILWPPGADLLLSGYFTARFAIWAINAKVRVFIQTMN